MKYLYAELDSFYNKLETAFENDQTERLAEITENDYFIEVLDACEAIAEMKKVLIDFGYDLE
tara:strand:- start:12 stop:197 length:186 start_codon:yes stop_codon:yes gene_type:complete